MTYLVTLEATLDMYGNGHQEIKNFLVGKVQGQDRFEAGDKVQLMIDEKYEGDIRDWIEDLNFCGYVEEAHFNIKEMDELANIG